jgi:hypothetical protein
VLSIRGSQFQTQLLRESRHIDPEPMPIIDLRRAIADQQLPDDGSGWVGHHF